MALALVGSDGFWWVVLVDFSALVLVDVDLADARQRSAACALLFFIFIDCFRFMELAVVVNKAQG